MGYILRHDTMGYYWHPHSDGWTHDRNKARIFGSRQEAEGLRRGFRGSRHETGPSQAEADWHRPILAASEILPA